MDIQQLLEIGVKQQASDIHLVPGQHPILRINGDLAPLADLPIMESGMTRELLLSVMTAEQQQQFEIALELDFAVMVNNVGNFRANAFHQTDGMAGVFRVIPSITPTLDDLGMPPVFKRLLDLPNGLILLTGPTGSGKSTTLAAMVDHINTTQSCHIITIEDPIEYTHHSKKSIINQRQVHRDTRSFDAALRSALREDPDVILVGEMRDLETIRLALTAAETGHLVLATLHTSSAPRAISRMVDVFATGEKTIIRNMLSESLQAVICQTLLKSTAGGRVAALEVMLGVPAIRNLIREDKIAQMYTVIQNSSELGMCTLDQSLKNLMEKNKLSSEVALEVALNKEIFHR